MSVRYVLSVSGILNSLSDFYSDPLTASGVGYSLITVLLSCTVLTVVLMVSIVVLEECHPRKKIVALLVALALISGSILLAIIVNGMGYESPRTIRNDKLDSQAQTAVQANVNNLDSAVDSATNKWGVESQLLTKLSAQHPSYSYVASKSTGPHAINVNRINAETVIISARGGSGNIWCADVYTYAPATYGQVTNVHSGTDIPLADCTGMDSGWNQSYTY